MKKKGDRTPIIWNDSRDMGFDDVRDSRLKRGQVTN